MTRSRPLQPPKEQRRLVLARHFIDAVTPMLEAGESYSDVSVERLITAVDISRSTFYSYFADKGALLQAMGEDVTIDLAEAGAHWFELEGDLQPTQIADALGHLFSTYRRHRGLLSAITEAAAYDTTIRELHQRLVERAVEGIVAHIEAEQRAGYVGPDIDPPTTARWIAWMLERGLYQAVGPADDATAEHLLQSMAFLIWRVLYA